MGTAPGDAAAPSGSSRPRPCGDVLLGPPPCCFHPKLRILPSPPLPPGSHWQIPILHFPAAGLLNPASWKRFHPALAALQRVTGVPPSPPAPTPMAAGTGGDMTPPKCGVPISCPVSWVSPQNRGESGGSANPSPPTPPLPHHYPSSPVIPKGTSQNELRTHSHRDRQGLPHFPEALQSPTTPFHTPKAPSQPPTWKEAGISPSSRTRMEEEGGDAPMHSKPQFPSSQPSAKPSPAP